jgi:M6 family metalloprotease-like protein
MTTSRTLLMRRLTLLALFSAILLVSVSPTLQATSRCEIPTTDGTATKDHIALSMSFGSAYSEELSSANLQTSAIAANSAPPKIEELLVLKAKVSDKEFTTSMAEINVTMSNNVKQYYEEVSYNQTIIVATTIPKNYTMPHSESYYGQDSGNNEPHVRELVNSTLYAAKSDVDAVGGYSAFKHIIIVHSGEDEAMPPNNNNSITSQFLPTEYGPYFVEGGAKVMNACVVSDQDPLGVVAHELGHSMGLPDLYNTGTALQGNGDDFVGPWDLMAEGSWNPYNDQSARGTSPSHPTTWCKIKLGWITPSKIVQITQSSIQGGLNATVFLVPEELQNGTLALRIVLNNGSYYLIEAREKIGYDKGLPSVGVLFLYCDDSKPSGQGPVRLQSDHPPDLSSLAPYNVGVLGYKDFFEDKGADIGIKILNKWVNGTFKILVGQWTPVHNAPSEYVGIASIPVIIVIVGCVAFSVIVLVVYMKRGRQKRLQSDGTVPVIKLS